MDNKIYLPHEMCDVMSELTDSEVGRLVTWMIKQARGDNPPAPEGREKVLVPYCNLILHNQEKYRKDMQ